MKKFFLLFIFSAALDLYAQQTYVPDDHFENYLETHTAAGSPVSIGDANSMGDGVMNDTVPTNKINVVTYLNISSLNISDLTGIEDFSALQNLNCSHNQITTLNLDQNTSLTDLNCRYNHLNGLDMSPNTALVNLNCNHNQLTTLNVSQNTDLVYLLCNFNQLTTLDVSQNTRLELLFCDFNQIDNLDISHNPSLYNLACNNNQMTSLNTDDDSSLMYLHCENNHLSSLNVEHNENLVKLYCFSNQINILNLGYNTSLNYLKCNNNQLDSLNLQNGNNVNMIYFNATNNPNLACVYVNEPGYMNSHWPNAIDNTAHYVLNYTQCDAYVDVETLMEDYFQVYPNPVQDILQIHSIQKGSLQISDASGKIILRQELQPGDNRIPVNRLPGGLYLLQLSTVNQNFTTQLIKN